ncbi:MAG TPA: FxLYD domain-containing protein [Chitinophagaceae bacterium]
MKQYRLLRNNKESGPYSAEELIQSGFKPYDLIWLDGKSAAWRYPGEIEEFKPYAPAVEEQPFDRFYKKPSVPESTKEITTSLVKTASAPVSVNSSGINAIPSVAVKAEKPRIRIKADSRKIEMPVASESIVEKEKPVLQEERVKPVFQKEKINPAFENETIKKETLKTAQTSNPDWKDMWLDWEEEKKAVSALNKISVKEHPQTIETNFSQSFDETKDSYAEALLIKPKRNSSISKSGNLVTVFILIGVILGFGMWVGLKWSGKNNTITQQKMANIQPQPVTAIPQSEAAQEQTSAAVNDNAETFSTSPKDQDTSYVNQPIERNTIASTTKSQPVRNPNKLTESKSVYETKQQDPVKNSTPPQQSDANVLLSNKNIQENDVAAKSVAAQSEKLDNPTEFNHFKPQPKITDFISVDTYSPSPVSAVGVKLRVQNISDIPVDMVMVDIHYYDVNGKYQAGATIYVRNIGAGQTITVPAPDNSHAVKVDYRIAMVSSEKNNMYLIAD